MPEAIRIGIVTGPSFPVPSISGGAIAKIWHGLAKEFTERGHEVIVYSRKHPQLPDVEVQDDIRFIRVKGFDQSLSLTKDLAKDFLFAVQLCRRLQRSDVLVINDFWLPVIAGWFRSRFGRIVINANRFPKKQYFLYRHTDLIACASQAVQNAIVNQTPAVRSRCRTISNPIDTKIFSPSELRTDSKEILYVGRIHPEKGLSLLIKAFARVQERFPDWRLRIVGPQNPNQGGGGEAYLHDLLSIAPKCSVVFDGPVFDNLKLSKIYQNCEIFCYPSIAEKGEAMGISALEAMACKKPVLVSSLECFLDFVHDGQNGLIFNHRETDPHIRLASALEQLVSDRELRDRLGQQAWADSTQYSYRAIADQYLTAFHQLIGRQ